MLPLDLDLEPYLDARHALLALAGLSFLWLAVFARGFPSLRGRAPAKVAFPSDTSHTWPRPVGLWHDDAVVRAERMLAEQLRHPSGGANTAPSLPPPMLAAILILAAAVCRPDRIDDVTAGLLAESARNPEAPLRTTIPDMAVHKAIEDASAKHAWWECAAVEMMGRARAAGSWITTNELRFLARTEPALLAALSAGPGGTVALEGAGILAHYKAEKVGGFGIVEPHIEPAMAHLFKRIDASYAA